MTEQLKEGLAQLGLTPPEGAVAQMVRYAGLLLEQNKMMNLTAIKEPAQVAALHFLDSAALLGCADLRGKSLVDVGTGAGFPGMVLKESKKAVPLEETRMQELFRAIHVGNQEKIRKEAIKETEKLHKNAATISQYNLATMEIVSGFFKFCANNSMDFNEISGNVQNLYERVTQFDENSMTNWIINMSTAISEKLRSTRNSTSRRIITDAQNIVKDRYMEPDLSLDDVCADLGVSNSYFSSSFKKETGQSFVSYLTDYRMDRAEELVLNTDEKSYKIAEKVGYQDANYFSYVFKKKFGVSPSKYRASGKQQSEKQKE